MVLADYQAYLECQEKVAEAFRDQEQWTRMSILNVARMGKFSSDRSIREYCEKIWGVKPHEARTESARGGGVVSAIVMRKVHRPIGNSGAKYNNRQISNLNMPLWQLVRASTAAPTYFPPELVDVGEAKFLFVDGGVTMYNNPAFQLFLMATVEPYNLNWPTGTDKMLIVSVGTGTSPDANVNLQPDEMNLLYNASSIPSALMFAALNEQDFLCRVFGDCLSGRSSIARLAT